MFVFAACQSSKKLESLPLNTLRIGTHSIPFGEIQKEIKEEVLTFEDPFGNGKQNVVGFPFEKVLAKFLGENWVEMDGIFFTALDGYKVEIPVKKILRYKPLLAYRYVDASKPFNIDTRMKRYGVKDLGPYYLVWNNIKHKELYKKFRDDWIYQVIRIDSIRHSSQFTKINKELYEWVLTLPKES